MDDIGRVKLSFLQTHKLIINAFSTKTDKMYVI